MTTFWILAAGLAGLAVLFAVTPLLLASLKPAQDPATASQADTDQAQLNLEIFRQQLAELDVDLSAGKLDQTVYEAARRDLERELLQDLGDRDPLTTVASQPSDHRTRRLPGPAVTALSLLLAIPVLAWAVYGLIGNQALIPQLEQVAASGGAGQARGQNELPPLDELVARLEQRLEQQPDDAEGWMMLGRTYFATGDRERAQSALARAYELDPNDALIVMAYAESIATNNDNQLEGRPAELISEALELEPDNPTARWLAGMVAFQRGQFRSAATTWRNLLEKMEPESEDAAELRTLISEAEQRAGLPEEARAPRVAQAAIPSDAADTADTAGASDEAPAPEGPPTGVNPAEQQDADAASASAEGNELNQTRAAGKTAGIQVQVALSPELSGRLPPNTPVFIYAKAAAGPPMPLAVQRATLGDLPLQIRLDDSMAMMPSMQLSSFPEIIVGARVSPSGQAMASPGDLQGETGPVSSDTADAVSVHIDQVRR
ncbi:c-type cytochrome biogenesis protein CcmI [Halochromatium salexigens]|uniref:C-type cytochrome biogenesis protein CcmI n=1 Tax=Halochromatium salexigens TaxID=49447 RepID=A0AAJ0XH57_HALSE|nr:c-type cytochrome biogenesis protein CcmI [Halochromatium salexigens]MBK5931337.1 c-type cytochrome biogenesis protein CcmI [Halochromatium salexigens]